MIEMSDLKLSCKEKEIPVKTFKYKDYEFEVLTYLPIKYKYDIIIITLQKAFDENNNYYNPLLIDEYFHLHLFKSYVRNITWDPNVYADKEDDEVYDELVSCGLMEEFLKTMPENEYNDILGYLNDTQEAMLKYKNGIFGFLNDTVAKMPLNAEKAVEILKDFKEKDAEQLISMVREIQGGKPFEEAE